MRWTTTIIAMIAMIALLATSNEAVALSDAERRTAGLCEAATRKTEVAERLPRGLLGAISLKETGRWDAAAKRSAPWPWTVTSGGPGVHHETKAKALAAVKDFQARGVKNIDVGCMQVNLRYHPHAFDNLQAALDPVTNTNYAGAHLRQLREDHRSWNRAVERYHSSDPERGKAYRTAVVSRKWWKLDSGVISG
jgi:hypothetical protein